MNCAAVPFLKDGYVKQQYTYFNNKKPIAAAKVLFQLFFCAAEQWHPVAIHAKILTTKISQAGISVQRKINQHLCVFCFCMPINIPLNPVSSAQISRKFHVLSCIYLC